MARKSIAYILKFTSSLPSVEEKVKCLQQNDNAAIRTVLKYCFDPKIKWLLPEGTPPYKPCEYPNMEHIFYSDVRRLYLFVEGGNDNIKPLRREALFIDLLQTIDPEDAELLASIKDKKLPWKGLTKRTVLKAYPGLFEDDKEEA